MSAFDEARSGAAPTARRGVRAPGAAVRAGGPGGAATASAIEVVSGGDGYQSADAAYASMCSAVEADLNSASQAAAQLRKQRDQVGARQDSEDLRHRMCVAAPTRAELLDERAHCVLSAHASTNLSPALPALLIL